MPNDNVRDEDRERFERVFIETQGALMRRFTNEDLPNEVLETVIARLVAYRAAITREDIEVVMVRVLEYASSYEKDARRAIALARLITGEKP